MDASWDHARLESLVHFLNFDFLVVFVLSGTVNWCEIAVVTLHHARTLFRIFFLLLTPFHFVHILLEWVEFFWDLTAAYRWKFKTCELIYVTRCCVNLFADFTSEVLFCLSVFNTLGTNHRPIDYHVLVNVALSNVSNRSNAYL